MKIQKQNKAIPEARKHFLKVSDLIRISRKFNLTEEQMALLAGVSVRTFKNKSSVLSVHISERVMQLEQLYQVGLDVFDSNEASFHTWLTSKVPALNRQVPRDLIMSLTGIEMVKAELLRIEYGIY